MPKLYVVTYIVRQNGQQFRGERSQLAEEFIRETNIAYDVGDDPSFFSAKRTNGPVTWGVCRADVRCNIKPDDWVAFFAAGKAKKDRTSYRFIAAHCVERKISQLDIFQRPENHKFKNYLNLLVRPCRKGWAHHEPLFERGNKDLHDDWLWRICRAKNLRKDKVDLAGEKQSVGSALPFPPEKNYVIFSEDTGITNANPPVVAIFKHGDDRETWCSNQRSVAIKKLMFAETNRWLRTKNRYQPHRHVVRELKEENWPDLLRAELKV